MGKVARRKVERERQRVRRRRARSHKLQPGLHALSALLGADAYEEVRQRRADDLMRELGRNFGRFLFRDSILLTVLRRMKPPLGMRMAVRRGEVQWSPDRFFPGMHDAP